jgi:hypothetical protein
MLGVALRPADGAIENPRPSSPDDGNWQRGGVLAEEAGFCRSGEHRGGLLEVAAAAVMRTRELWKTTTSIYLFE